MRFFLISLVFCLMLSCGSYPKKQHLIPTYTLENSIVNPYFSDISKDYVYKARIEVYDNDFGGLLIIKKLAQNHHRIAFTTEMGNKLFDFSLMDNEFKVNYCVSELNRKLLIKVLRQDFTTLTTENLSVKHQFKNQIGLVFETELYGKPHFYYSSDNLNKIVTAKHGKEKVNFTFSNIKDNVANEIDITHSNIKLKINLKTIY